MNKAIITAILVLSSLFHSAFTQNLTIKPFAGYLKVFMKDVNNVMEEQITTYRDLSEENIPYPEDFNGEPVFGSQFEYHLNEGYYFSFSFYWYNEETRSVYREALKDFLFDREVSLLNFSLSIHYYLNYSSWKRINPYLGAGVGLAFASSTSRTKTRNLTPFDDTDTRGDFSTNDLTFTVSGGVDLKITRFLFLWGEAGYQFANFGQMDGEIRLMDGTRVSQQTFSNFDYSGLFIWAGLGVHLPLF